MGPMRSIAALSMGMALLGRSPQAGTSAHAGGSSGTDWGIGLKGGVNSAKLERDPAETERERLGFNAGLMFVVGANRPVGISFEPTYVVKGSEFKLGKSFRHADLAYLELPLLLRLSMPIGPFIRVYGMAGPDLAVNVNVDLNGESILAGNDIEPVDAVLDLGGGAGIALLRGVRWIGDVRYSHGFDGFLVEDTEPGQEWDIRNLKVSTGLLFSFPSG